MQGMLIKGIQMTTQMIANQFQKLSSVSKEVLFWIFRKQDWLKLVLRTVHGCEFLIERDFVGYDFNIPYVGYDFNIPYMNNWILRF